PGLIVDLPLTAGELDLPEQGDFLVQVVQLAPEGGDDYLAAQRMFEAGHAARAKAVAPERDALTGAEQHQDRQERQREPVADAHAPLTARGTRVGSARGRRF